MNDDSPPRVRTNALSAAAFVPLRDVDPRVVEALLDSLEDAGVAAYSEPRTGAVETDHDERLWVDGDRRELAEAVVAAELPGLLAETAEPDPDELFAAIVANWDSALGAADDVRPWPDSEHIEQPSPPAQAWRASASELLPALEGEREADEGHYVPPPPPPVPPPDMTTKFAIVGIVLGVVCLLGLQRLLGFPTGKGAYVFGALVLVASVGTLFARLRDTPRVDDGPDDGAVV